MIPDHSIKKSINLKLKLRKDWLHRKEQINHENRKSSIVFSMYVYVCTSRVDVMQKFLRFKSKSSHIFDLWHAVLEHAQKKKKTTNPHCCCCYCFLTTYPITSLILNFNMKRKSKWWIFWQNLSKRINNFYNNNISQRREETYTHDYFDWKLKQNKKMTIFSFEDTTPFTILFIITLHFVLFSLLVIQLLLFLFNCDFMVLAIQ